MEHLIKNSTRRVHILHTKEIGHKIHAMNDEEFIQAPNDANYSVGDIIIVSYSRFGNNFIEITSKEEIKLKFPSPSKIIEDKDIISVETKFHDGCHLHNECYSNESKKKYIRKIYQQVFSDIWNKKLKSRAKGYRYGFKDAKDWSLNPVDYNQQIDINLLEKRSSVYEDILSKINNDLHQYEDKVRFQNTLLFIRKLTKNYSDKLGYSEVEVLKALEKNRTYWSANYYQESKFPFLEDSVNIYETKDDLKNLIDRDNGFKCGSCGEISYGSGAEYECSCCGYKTYGFLSIGESYQIVIKDDFLNNPIVHKILVPVSILERLERVA